MNFNEKQREMINGILEGGFISVVAGAGAGKSTTLIQSVVELIDSGVNPMDILVMSYTKDSVKDLQDKLKKRGKQYLNTGISTIHSVCYKILKLIGYQNLDKQLPYYVIENALRQAVANKELEVGNIISFINYVKMKGILPGDFIDDVTKEDITSRFQELEFNVYMFLYSTYEELKRQNNCYDFSDYILIVRDMYLKGNKPYQWDYVIIDEAQDANKLTLELVDLFCRTENISLIYDPRQSLYGFNSATPEIALNKINTGNYSKKKMINMNINYRSCADIVALSNYVIRNQLTKDILETESFNKKVLNQIKTYNLSSVFEEARFVADKIEEDIKNGIPLEEIMVVYRNNVMVDNLEAELKKREIDYVLHKQGSFFNRNEVTIFLCMLRLCKDENDNVAFETLTKLRPGVFKFLSKSLMEMIEKFAIENKVSYLQSSILVKGKAYEITNMKNFIKMIEQLKAMIDKNKTVVDLVSKIAVMLNYDSWAFDKSKTDEEYENFLETLKTLKKIAEGHTIDSFLELAYKPTTPKKQEGKGVRLMTVHGAKGLEAVSVYMIGLQNEKFPSSRASIEEEQRILFVGVSRPKEKLTVTGIGDSIFLDLVNKGIDEIYK